MASTTIDNGTYKPYDSKAVTRRQASAYSSFGWVLSKERPVVTKKKKNSPEVVVRRKLGFADNPDLARCEGEYLKREKKKYRQLPILGIICFILMIAFLFVAAMELAYGISAIIEKNKAAKPAEEPAETAIVKILAEEPAATATEEKKDDATVEESTDIMGMVKEYAGMVKNDYLSYINNLFDGKTDETTNEYTPGITDKIKDMLPDAVKDYISTEILVGAIALILFIIFLSFFCEIAKRKKKRAKNQARLAALRREGEQIVKDMRMSDLSLMNKSERKTYSMQIMLTNAIRDALGSTRGGDDDDDDAYL